MKFKIIYLLFLGSCFCYSQNDSQLIKLREYYKSEAVVFKESYKPPFEIMNYKKSFTPTEAQIKEAERILVEQYNLSKKEIVDSINKNSKETLSYPKSVKNVKKRLCKYRRQYIGYTTKENDTIISVNLLNFKNKSKAKKYFSNWEKEYIIGFDGFYYENIEYFNVNLTDKKLSVGN